MLQKLENHSFFAGLFLVFMIVCVLLATGFQPAYANNRYASIVMDAETGLVLHQRYADKKLHPASLTKIMTLVMVFDALDHGDLDLKDRVKISRHAANMVPSKLGLKPGETIKVEDAIYALVTKSANDIAVALAEHIGGSEGRFAEMMTRKARSYGLRHTVFLNASGLHHSKQVSSARDMAMLARIILTRYKDYYHYFSRKTFTYAGHTYRNHNHLMNSYAGMDGIKTGYVGASGFNLVASVQRNGRRLIGVVFGGRTSRTRNAHMAKLLDSGFAKLGEIRLAHQKPPLPGRKPYEEIAVAALEVESAAELAAPIEQGDADPDQARRMEAGYIAISAHTGRPGYFNSTPKSLNNNVRLASAQTATAPVRQKASFGGGNLSQLEPAGAENDAPGWAVQLGAYKSKESMELAVRSSLQRLPKRYAGGKPSVAYVDTEGGRLYRARLQGYNETEARQVCAYLNNCIILAPRTNPR